MACIRAFAENRRKERCEENLDMLEEKDSKLKTLLIILKPNGYFLEGTGVCCLIAPTEKPALYRRCR
jgi:hypothetical protein